MKKLDFKNLRSKKAEELKKMAGEKSLEIIKTEAKIKAGQEKNLKKARNLKKEVAQILTIIKEMEILDKLQEVSKTK